MSKLSYCLNIIFISFFIWYFGIHKGVGRYYEKYLPGKDAFLKSPDYQARVNAYHELNSRYIGNKKKYIVFAGDSMIEQFPVTEIFPNCDVLNRGIGFDTTVGLLKRVGINLNNLPISDCFIMIGHNDFQYRNVDQIIQKYQEILSQIRADRVFVMGVPPGSDQQLNDRKYQLNEKIHQLSKSEPFEYIDLYPLFMDSQGVVKTAYFYDGVHLTMDGYRLIKREIELKTGNGLIGCDK